MKIVFCFNSFLRLTLSASHSSSISSGNRAPYNRIKVSSEHIAPSHSKLHFLCEKSFSFERYLAVEQRVHFDHMSYLNTLIELHMYYRLNEECKNDSAHFRKTNFVHKHRKIMHWQMMAGEHNSHQEMIE